MFWLTNISAKMILQLLAAILYFILYIPPYAYAVGNRSWPLLNFWIGATRVLHRRPSAHGYDAIAVQCSQ